LDSLDVEERPPLIMKLVEVQHYAQLLARPLMDNSYKPDEIASILEKLNKIYVANLK
jgi:hypothetical protein